MASRVRGNFGSMSGIMEQRGGRIVKAVNDGMQEEMKKVQQKAKDYCPVDDGYLEKAIKLTSENRRRMWTVYVDDSMPADGKSVVGDYAMRIHEGIGWENLGEKSLAKMALTGYVGKKFLEKAFVEAVNSGMVDRLAELAKQKGISDAP